MISVTHTHHTHAKQDNPFDDYVNDDRNDAGGACLLCRPACTPSSVRPNHKKRAAERRTSLLGIQVDRLVSLINWIVATDSYSPNWDEHPDLPNGSVILKEYKGEGSVLWGLADTSSIQ